MVAITRAMICSACGVAAWMLLAALPARADLETLDYSYIEANGSPFLTSPVKLKLTNDSVNFDGTGVGGEASVGITKNFHFRITVDSSEADSDTFKFEDPNSEEIIGDGKVSLDYLQLSFVPSFNFRVAKNTDVILGLGATFGQLNADIRLRGREANEGLLKGTLDDEEWGVVGRGGVRSRVWRGLELFTNFNVSSVSLLENAILFNIGARYTFLDSFALGVLTNVSTDSFVSATLSGRIYYMDLYRKLKHGGW